MSDTVTPHYAPAEADTVSRFLATNYLPAGYRAQVMVGHPTIPALAEAATAAVLRAGADPARRVALVHPRPGEDAMREVDVIEYFRKYGHEYCAALLVAQPSLDTEAVTAAAHAVGCAILWDVSSIGDVSVEQLSAWSVDAAVSTSPHFVSFGAI